MEPVAGVLGVGDELLLGTAVDTNGTWLAGRLSDLGFRVSRRVLVGDSEDAVRGALEGLLQEAELVVITGGLGPTPDDRTRYAVAQFLGRPLEPDADVVAHLEARYRARGLDAVPPLAQSMALVPAGAQVLSNPGGAAPGLALEAPGDGLVVLLPGIPSEMRDIFQEEVRPLLLRRFEGRLRPVFQRVLCTTGISESSLAEAVRSAFPEGTGPVSVAFLPNLRGVRLRLMVRPGGEGREIEELNRVAGVLVGILAGHVYFSPSDDLAQALGVVLKERGATIAVAESCTGGLVCKRLTEWPGSSEYFLGGVVAYADQAKMSLLGVEGGLLERRGAVSREVAEEMARGVAWRFGASVGIGITGIAGPGGGTAEKPVGTVWLAGWWQGEVRARVERFGGSRREVRERAAQSALHLMYRWLEEGGRGGIG